MPTLEDIQEAYNTILTGDLFRDNCAQLIRNYPTTHGALKDIVKRSYRQFYSDTRHQSQGGNYIGGFKLLSEANLRHVQEYTNKIEGDDFDRIYEALSRINFYWKSSTTGSSFENIMKSRKLLSTTSVLAQYNRIADYDNEWLPYHLGAKGEKIYSGKVITTNPRELHYREDGGFVFFRVETNGDPIGRSQTRYGTCQFIFDTIANPDIHRWGWVSLRDVFHPYADEDFNITVDDNGEDAVDITSDKMESYKNIVTAFHNGNTSQRISVYADIDKGKIAAVSDDKIVPIDKYKNISEAVLTVDNNRNVRSNTRHYFYHSDKRAPSIRDENVLESVFVGADIVPGIMHSLMRALHELPPLWRMALNACGHGFPAFIEPWLRRFYRVEGKYPVEIDIRRPSEIGLTLYQDGKKYDPAGPGTSSGKDALKPEVKPEVSAEVGTSGVLSK